MNEREISQSMAGRYGYGAGNFVGFSGGSAHLYYVCLEAYGHPTTEPPSSDLAVAAGSSPRRTVSVSLLVLVTLPGLMAELVAI